MIDHRPAQLICRPLTPVAEAPRGDQQRLEREGQLVDLGSPLTSSTILLHGEIHRQAYIKYCRGPTCRSVGYCINNIYKKVSCNALKH